MGSGLGAAALPANLRPVLSRGLKRGAADWVFFFFLSSLPHLPTDRLKPWFAFTFYTERKSLELTLKADSIKGYGKEGEVGISNPYFQPSS